MTPNRFQRIIRFDLPMHLFDLPAAATAFDHRLKRLPGIHGPAHRRPERSMILPDVRLR
jgi:hypothetical protein